MSRKQLLLLCTCSLVPWTFSSGFAPLLPLFVLRLGVSQAVSGLYLAFIILAVAAGTFLAGWLADKFQRRKLTLIISGLAMSPLLWAMGQASNIWQLAAAHGIVSALYGAQIALISILAGLFATDKERGKVLGAIGTTAALGAIAGGLSLGPIVDQWGYPTMFIVFGFFTLLLPIAGVFIKDKKIDRVASDIGAKQKEKINFGGAFFVLLFAHLIGFIVFGIANMGRSISMNELGFTATAITGTVVVAGLISLPFPLVLGWLSDRFGRKRMMIICYASFTLCIVIFALSKSLWQFWVGASLLRIGINSNNVGTAFVADLVEPKALGRGVSLFQSMYWFGTMIGLMVAGYAFQSLGIATTLLLGGAFSLVGIALVFAIRVVKQREPATE